MKNILCTALVALLAALAEPALAADPAPVAKPPPEAVKPAAPAAKPAAKADVEEIEEVTDVAEITAWNPMSWSDARQFPALERGINLLTTRTVPQWHGSIIIDHRAYEPISTAPFDDFLGLDAGSLKIGLGLRLGLLDSLDVGIYRVNGTIEPFDTYELDARWRFLDQARHGLSAAVRAGGTWYYVPAGADDSGAFGQLIVERTFFRRMLLSVSALYHSNSTSATKNGRDTRWSLGVGALLDVRLAKWLSWELEAVPAVAGYRDTHPTFSTAAKFITNRHTFSIVFSTSQYTAADGVYANTASNIENVVIGFKIVRELP